MGVARGQVSEGLSALGCHVKPTISREAAGTDTRVADPWSYASRVPQSFDSRSLAFLPAVLALIGDGLGIFLAYDAAVGRVAFWSNPTVWVGIMHAAFCVAIGAWMFLGKWIWTAAQMGFFSLTMLAVPYALHFASLIGLCLYGSAPMWAKAALLATSLLWHVGWAAHVVRRCSSIWGDQELRQRTWIRYESATVYRQFAAKEAMDRVRLSFYPGNAMALGFVFLIIPLVWMRQELATFFGGSFIHVFLVFFGASVSTLGLTFSVFSILFLMVYPARIVARTGNPVLVDMMTPANAPTPGAQ